LALEEFSLGLTDWRSFFFLPAAAAAVVPAGRPRFFAAAGFFATVLLFFAVVEVEVDEEEEAKGVANLALCLVPVGLGVPETEEALLPTRVYLAGGSGAGMVVVMVRLGLEAAAVVSMTLPLGVVMVEGTAGVSVMYSCSRSLGKRFLGGISSFFLFSFFSFFLSFLTLSY
jgi:hypothetical protein